MTDFIILCMEMIGVVAFAISGTLVGISKRSDIIGCLFFALVTTFGGGFFRDIILGEVPHVLWDTGYYIRVIVALAVSVICILLAFHPKASAYLEKHQNDFLLNLSDAIGLSVFCVCGVEALLASGVAYSRVTLIFVGTLTGVGGGILRDVFASEIPLVFRKHVYLLPAFLGTLLYVCIYPHVHELLSMFLSVGLIIVVRILAIVYRWNLPTPLKKK